MSYKITYTNLSNNKMFLLDKSNFEKRFDPQFYLNRVVIKNSIKLSKLVEIKGGKRLPKGQYYSSEITRYRYFRVSNMKEFGLIDWNNLEYISEDIFTFLERYKIEKGDVLISIAGTVGKIAFIENDVENIILTENCAKLIIKDKTKLLPKYLHILLELSTTKRQIELGFIQTTIPKLGFDKIEQIELPPIPEIKLQENIIEIYENSILQKAKYESEAEILLASIDSYLLKELGITLPTQEENTLKNRMFIRTIQSITSNRFDPFYHTDDFAQLDEILDNKLFIKFSSIIHNITKGETPLWKGESYVENGIPFLKVQNISNDGIFGNITYITEELHNSMVRSKLKGGELLYTMAGSIGIATYLPNDFGEANINQAIAKIILKDNIQFNKDYLLYCINSIICKKQAQRFLTVSAQPNINFDQIKAIKIPAPTIEKQIEIAKHITQIRQEAQALKNKTKLALQKANEEIENLLLN